MQEPFFKATLPFLPPGINHSYRIIRIGRSHTLAASTDLKDFKDQSTKFLLLHQYSTDWAVVQAISASKQKIPLSAQLCFYFPTLWKRDLDGGEKHLVDVVFEFFKSCGHKINDTCIVDKHSHKFADRANPRCEISLRVYEGDISW